VKSDWEKWNVQNFFFSWGTWIKRNPKSGCYNPWSSDWEISRAKSNVNVSISEIQINACPGIFVLFNSLNSNQKRLPISGLSNNPAKVNVQGMPCSQDSRDPSIFNCENVSQSNSTHTIRATFQLPTAIASVYFLINRGELRSKL